MATVIDELVVRLGLDPAEFDAGEARLVQSLRRLEAAAERGGKQVTTTVGRGAVDFFRAIENPIGALRRQFEAMALVTVAAQKQVRDVGDEGKKAGEQVVKSMGAATVGMRGFGIAGLAAFAAVAALEKALQATSNVAGRVLTTGIGAAAAGTNINEFGAIAQAFLTKGHVPMAETENWLATYNEMQGQAKAGLDPGLGYMTNLNMKLGQAQALIGPTGINPWQDSPEEMAFKLSRAMRAAPEQQAYAAGRALDLSRQMVHTLRQSGLEDETAFQRSRAPTNEDEARAQRFLNAQDRLATAWLNLERHVVTRLEPALTAVLDWLDNLLAPGPSDTRSFVQRLFQGPLSKPGDTIPAAALGPGGKVTSAVGYFEGQGWSHAQAAGIVGRLYGESGLNPNASNDIGGGHRGIAQWDRERWARFQQMYPGDNSFEAQLAYVQWELTHAEAAAGASIRSQTTARGAGMATEEYERAGDPAFTRRAAAMAEQIAGDRAASATTGTPGHYHVSDPLDWILGPAVPSGPSATAKLPPISSIQRSNATSNVTTINHGDNVTNVGGVTVHAPTREGEDIGNAVRDKVSQLTPLVSPANTGLA